MKKMDSSFLRPILPPDGYACLRDRFLGPYRTERDPLAVETGICEIPGQKGGNHCGVLQKT